MQYVTFNARCPFEIGDKVIAVEEGKERTITDIACVHYLKDGYVDFLYELDGNGKYVQVQTRPAINGIEVSFEIRKEK